MKRRCASCGEPRPAILKDKIDKSRELVREMEQHMQERDEFSVGVERLSRVVFQRCRLIANTFHFVDLVRSIDRANRRRDVVPAAVLPLWCRGIFTGWPGQGNHVPGA